MSGNELNEFLTKQYYDLKTGFTGINKFYLKVIDEAKKIQPIDTRKLINEFYKNQEINQLSKKATVSKKDLFQINGEPLTMQLDKMYIPKALSTLKEGKINKSLKDYDTQHCFLLMVDVVSRKCWITKLPNRTMISTLIGYYDILDELNSDAHKLDDTKDIYFANDKGIVLPVSVQTDDEFTAKQFVDENELLGIPLKSGVSADDHIVNGDRLGKIDRLCRTLKAILLKYLYSKDNLSNINIGELMKEIADSYNNNPHRSLKGKSPNDVFNSIDLRMAIYKEAEQYNKNLMPTVENKYEINDYVRIYERKETHDKETPQFSKALYQIVGRSGTKFNVKDSNGKAVERAFKISELQKVTPSEVQHHNPIETKTIIAKAKRVNKGKLEMKKDDINPEVIIGAPEQVKKPKAITRESKFSKEAKELMSRWGFDKRNVDTFDEDGKVSKKKK